MKTETRTGDCECGSKHINPVTAPYPLPQWKPTDSMMYNSKAEYSVIRRQNKAASVSGKWEN